MSTRNQPWGAASGLTAEHGIPNTDDIDLSLSSEQVCTPTGSTFRLDGNTTGNSWPCRQCLIRYIAIENSLRSTRPSPSTSARALQQTNNQGAANRFFCVRIESAVRFDFESNFRIESAVYTTQAVTPSNELQGAPCRRTGWAYMLTTSVVNVCVVLMCYCVCTM